MNDADRITALEARVATLETVLCATLAENAHLLVGGAAHADDSIRRLAGGAALPKEPAP